MVARGPGLHYSPRPMRSLSRVAASAAFVLLLSSCTGTKVIQTWRDPQYTPHDVKRIFVGCVGPTDANRVILENTFAKALLDHGFLSATSTGVFGYDVPEKEQVVQFVKDNQIDLVIILRVTKKTETAYMPGTVDYVPPAAYYGGWWPTYGTGDGFWYTSAYMEEDTTVAVETTVYSARASPEKLVWSAASTTINVQDAKSGSKSLVAALVADLVKAGILPK
ncbi:MAG: hypothetical protein RJA59_2159 [Pseudomonadota bacterium]